MKYVLLFLMISLTASCQPKKKSNEDRGENPQKPTSSDGSSGGGGDGEAIFDRSQCSELSANLEGALTESKNNPFLLNVLLSTDSGEANRLIEARTALAKNCAPN